MEDQNVSLIIVNPKPLGYPLILSAVCCQVDLRFRNHNPQSAAGPNISFLAVLGINSACSGQPPGRYSCALLIFSVMIN